MAKAFGALLLLALLTLAAQAAPAPFAKPTRQDDAPVTVVRLKPSLLTGHNMLADRSTEDSSNTWLVMGHTPMVGPNGQLMYERSNYRVSATSGRAGCQLTLTVIPRM